MDAWLTRIVAPKPVSHGDIGWFEGDDAAEKLAAYLKDRDVHHVMAYDTAASRLAAVLGEKLAACGIAVEQVSKEAVFAEQGYAVITGAESFHTASARVGQLRRQAAKEARKLHSLRSANAEEEDRPQEAEDARAAADAERAQADEAKTQADAQEPLHKTYALNIDDAIAQETAAAPTQEPPAGEKAPAAYALNIDDAITQETTAAPAQEPSAEEKAPAAYSLNIDDAIAQETTAQADPGAAEDPSAPVGKAPETAPVALPEAPKAPEAPAPTFVPPLVLLAEGLDVMPLAEMTVVPDAVVMLPGFAEGAAAEEIQDRFLVALVSAAEHLLDRRAPAQLRRDAQAAVQVAAYALQEGLTAERTLRCAMLAGRQCGYAAVLGDSVHSAHPSVSRGAAQLACLRELLRRYGSDGRHGMALAALAAGCGEEKAKDEANAAAFLQWLDEVPARLALAQQWLCIRNTELPAMSLRISRQVKVAAPRHLSVNALRDVLFTLKEQETDEPPVETLCERQQAFFETGATLPLDFRFQQLDAVKRWLVSHETQISEALFADLGKSSFEAFETEVLLVREELHCLRTHLSDWAGTKWFRAPLMHFPSRCFTVQEPYGRVLIMAPWNYPFLLSMDPLLAALAAGNCVILKPSNYAPATAKLLSDMVRELFDPEYVAVVRGGREQNQSLLRQKFDNIFFTGSVQVGKLVMASAAEHLTPVTLELGGKSPCIVDETADIPLAAKRIVWGKFVNAGQTCVAPDYVLCHESVKDKLLLHLQREIRAAWTEDALQSPDLPRIVNDKHFARLSGLLACGQTVIGGKTSPETRQIAPTVLSDVRWDEPVMQEEIFGPILPVLTYSDFDALLAHLRTLPKPLAGYLFTRSAVHEDTFLKRLSFGGGCINDVLTHLAVTCVPFGGVGESGMGSYHGRKSFETFSHSKSMLKKSLRLDVPVRYAPYTKRKLKLLRWFLK